MSNKKDVPASAPLPPEAATILICDDDPDIVSALQIYLQREGYATVAAYDGREALKKLSEQTVHLVLLDCMMPHMDGVTTLRFIREQSNLPVIFLTAKTEDLRLPPTGRRRIFAFEYTREAALHFATSAYRRWRDCRSVPPAR